MKKKKCFGLFQVNLVQIGLKPAEWPELLNHLIQKVHSFVSSFRFYNAGKPKGVSRSTNKKIGRNNPNVICVEVANTSKKGHPKKVIVINGELIVV